MLASEIGTTWARAGLVVLSSIALVIAIVIYVRISGLRSFSKMAAFDFVVTLAVGSILGAVAMSASSLADGLVAVASLLGVQAVIARLRYWGLDKLTDNKPVVLMAGPRFLDDNLRRTRVNRAEIREKLRQEGITHLDQVGAVIFETTGDISVLPAGDIDPRLLEDVEDSTSITGKRAT